jgi:hypothetical protein
MKPPYNTGILPLVAWYPALTYPRRSNRPGSLPVVVSECRWQTRRMYSESVDGLWQAWLKRTYECHRIYLTVESNHDNEEAN